MNLVHKDTAEKESLYVSLAYDPLDFVTVKFGKIGVHFYKFSVELYEVKGLLQDLKANYRRVKLSNPCLI